MSRQTRVVVFLVAAVSVGLAQLLAAQVVATGLVNPRGIAQAPNGWMYVAEAGNVGTGCAAPPAPPFLSHSWRSSLLKRQSGTG